MIANGYELGPSWRFAREILVISQKSESVEALVSIARVYRYRVILAMSLKIAASRKTGVARREKQVDKLQRKEAVRPDMRFFIMAG